MAQRVNTWLTSHTPAGVLYETDLRLRPDGASGLLVSSFGAFRDYQLKRAWTWEHQALTRARFCAGDAALGQRFEALRDEILGAAARPREALRGDRRHARARCAPRRRPTPHDLKHVEGGVIDLEFAVQALVLAERAATRSCSRTRATTRCSIARASWASCPCPSPPPPPTPTSRCARAPTRPR